MGFLFTLLAPPLGLIMRLCYSVVGNVGLAIIIFTFIVRILMFPLSVKQHKTTAKTQIFSPKLAEIRRKFAGNQQKMNEEMMKLQKQGYNPASGCLPMIATMLILFGVLGVVYGPLTYFERVEREQIEIAKEISLGVFLDEYVNDLENETIRADLAVFFADYGSGRSAVRDREEATKEAATEAFKKANPKAGEEELAEFEDEFKAQYRFITNEHNFLYNGLQAELKIVGAYKLNPAAFENSKQLNDNTISALKELEQRIIFLGIDFSQIPNMSFPIIIIPIISFIFAAGHTVVLQMIQKKTSPESLAQMGSMKYIMYFMPFVSLFISFRFPAGAGFYWALSSAMMIAQSLIINRIYPPDKIREEVLVMLDKKGFKDSVVVIEKHDGRTVEKKTSEMSSKESKEYYRKKLEEARKADLEKYGEVGSLPAATDKEEE
jgi:YidC/Oxa1 family membrane protein insertase